METVWCVNESVKRNIVYMDKFCIEQVLDSDTFFVMSNS
jgi:hypothetical protein